MSIRKKHKPTIFWVVGRFRFESIAGAVWDIQGVFTSEKDAVDACLDSTYFVGPMVKNKLVGHETQEWPGCYYPRRVND